MGKLLWGRIAMGIGAILIGVAPFLPYTYATVGSWHVAVRGVYMFSGTLIVWGIAVLIQALLGRGSLLLSWCALTLSSVALWRDAVFCTRDLGQWLGRAQLALSDINNLIIKVGIAPLHLVDSQEISGRALVVGFYLAVTGVIIALLGSLLWLKEAGKNAIWTCVDRCQCGQVLRSSFRYCPACARELRSNRDFCIKCGTRWETGWQYCPGCGFPRQEESADSRDTDAQI